MFLRCVVGIGSTCHPMPDLRLSPQKLVELSRRLLCSTANLAPHHFTPRQRHPFLQHGRLPPEPQRHDGRHEPHRRNVGAGNPDDQDDSIVDGILRRQNSNGRCYGRRAGSHVRSLHGLDALRHTHGPAFAHGGRESGGSRCGAQASSSSNRCRCRCNHGRDTHHERRQGRRHKRRTLDKHPAQRGRLAGRVRRRIIRICHCHCHRDRDRDRPVRRSRRLRPLPLGRHGHLRPAPQAAAQARPARHVPLLRLVREKLRQSGRHLQRHRVRHRGPARQERPVQRRGRRVHHRRRPRPQRRAAGRGRGVSGLCGLQRRHRCLHENA
ncbi:hypothetical protein B5807_08749 [Epicoccum nigrum]|uniref:Uncharacterized protein n=1 Tax=Epicoccum nigrum TaxID=105696 RepID=A0A1Y2LT82_EPING|nr:hypothetical protein B5807_08749 [Epicoccum nigrum]